MKALANRLRVAVAVAVTAGVLAGGAEGALVQVGDLVLRADGGFRPNALPRRAFTPIRFHGHADLSTRSGAMPPALQQAIVDFDRDGRLRTTGLASCAPGQVADSTPEQARRTCRAAIVGTGNVKALVALFGRPPQATGSPLTLFNGPRQAGHATVVAHARMTTPLVQTFAILIPIERRRGAFRYRATLDVPPIAPGVGSGALTHVSVKVGRRYRAAGEPRSYVAARCSDSVLQTRGRFAFSDGTVIAGSVMKGCRARR